jgi:hypothetical protein
MTAKNPITGDPIATKPVSESYRNGYGQIDWSVKNVRQSIRSNSDGSNVSSDADNGIPGGDTDSINVLQDGGDQG